MTRSELKKIIREELEKEMEEGMVAGVAIDPDMQATIMTAVPALVAAGLGIEFREEIADWLKRNTSKVKDIINKASK